MNEQNLTPGKYSEFTSARGKIQNAYDKIAGGNNYQKNARDLRVIQWSVVTVSAIATGFTNGFAHRAKIGDELSLVLAVLIIVFVERFYFVLRHGLTTTYQAGKQRFFAWICYRAIQVTMILNGAILTAYIVGLAVPAWLELWNHWSIAFHFALALIGVQAVRDSDAVVENQMLELKAATARQDLITARRVSAIGSPFALIAARIRGMLDAVALSFRLLFSGGGFSKQYMADLAQAEREQFSYIDLTPATGQQTQTLPARQTPGFVTQNPGPKSPRNWI
jgi:hypothetical protein